VLLPGRCGHARVRGDEYVLQDGLVQLHADLLLHIDPAEVQMLDADTAIAVLRRPEGSHRHRALLGLCQEQP
jgi:hypothetical protein